MTMSDDIEIILTLVTNLARARMKLQGIKYQNLLQSDKKIDRKEIGALMAGYKKAQSDLDEVLMSIAEI